MSTPRRLKWFGLGLLAAISLPVLAGTFNLFSPASGILKGNPTSYVTTAAASSDVISLWSGICSSGTFLRGDGSCQAAGGGGPIDLTSDVTGILPGANGGTGIAFAAFTGPASTLKTFTLPNASATILTTNAAVTVPQGGTGVTTLTGPIKGNGTSSFSAANAADIYGLWSGTCDNTTFLRGDGSCQSAGGGGGPIDLTSDVTGILPGANGGTGIAFAAFTGPASTLKTFTLPNASATILTTNDLVAVNQGGTGTALITGVIRGNGTGAFSPAAAVDITALWSGTCDSATVLHGNGACNPVNLQFGTTGTTQVANGGTGATTLTGLLQGNGTSPVTAVSNSTTVGQTLRVTGSNAYGWGALDLADADAVTGTLPAANGGRQADDVQVFNVGGATSWTKPSGAQRVYALVIAGGGGGGSGRKGAASTIRGGGSAGGGGGYSWWTLPASLLPSSFTVAVGAGGAGGASRTTSDTDGANGTAGGDSSLVNSGTTYLIATGGQAGNAGDADGSAGGGPGYGLISGGLGGASNASGAAGTSPTLNAAANGPQGGGAGGGVNASNANSNGAAGAASRQTGIPGGALGTGAGGNGGNAADAPSGVPLAGAGGGGGSGRVTGAAGNGGNGGRYGGGGGGGGGAVNAVNDSGAGGAGADGIVIIVTSF